MQLSPKTAYKRGRAFEYRVRNYFLALGYLVIRSPKSKGAYDLIVIGRNFLLLIQCKSHGVLPPGEWNALWEMAEKTYGRAILALRHKRKIKLFELTSAKTIKGAKQPMESVEYGSNGHVKKEAPRAKEANSPRAAIHTREVARSRSRQGAHEQRYSPLWFDA